MPSKCRFPAAAFSNTKVEVRNTGGLRAPSDSAGSKPCPIISVAGFSGFPPIERGPGFGRRRGVAAPIGGSLSWSMGRLCAGQPDQPIIHAPPTLHYLICLAKYCRADLVLVV